VLEVRDVPTSVAFYRSVVGLEPVRLQDYLAGKAPFVSGRVSAETIIDFFPPRLWRETARPQNPNHLCFTLSRQGYRNLKKRLARRRVAIVRRSRRNFGAQGYGISLYFLDPDGLTLEARYYRDTAASGAGGGHRSPVS
jgi:catechol 2,3-dioxygenase-like lactoylglutathione lyase family enzyme